MSAITDTFDTHISNMLVRIEELVRERATSSARAEELKRSLYKGVVIDTPELKGFLFSKDQITEMARFCDAIQGR